MTDRIRQIVIALAGRIKDCGAPIDVRKVERIAQLVRSGGLERPDHRRRLEEARWRRPRAHARQAGLLAAGCQSASYLGRFVVVVDEDVDPTDLFDVMWAMCTRCDPANDIEFVRRTWSGPLDPLLDKASSTNSRAIIDACRPFERLADFPMVARASPELRQKVKEKFADLLGKIGCA